MMPDTPCGPHDAVKGGQMRVNAMRQRVKLTLREGGDAART